MKPIDLGLHIGIGGEFRAILRDENMVPIYDSGWDSNRIVDNGLILFGATQGWSTFTHIGSDGSATVDTQSTLGTLLFSQSSTLSNDFDPVVGPDYERRGVIGRRFTAGQGTGTISELGIGPSSTSYPTSYLFCRHVLATPIVKSDVQTLDIYYAFNKVLSNVDATGTAVIDGITYDWVASRYNATAPVGGQHWYSHRPTSLSQYYNTWSGTRAGLTDSGPSGSALGAGGSIVVDDNGSGYLDFSVHYALSVGNGTDYLRTFLIQLSDTQTKHQVEFTQQAGQPNPGEGIPKDNTEEMDMSFRFTWGRHT